MPFVADVEPLAILLEVVADLGARRDLHPLVDDRPADAAVAADVDPVEKHRLLDVGEAVDPHVGEEDRAVDATAADDAARGDQRVGGDAHPIARVVGEDELGRRAVVPNSVRIGQRSL